MRVVNTKVRIDAVYIQKDLIGFNFAEAWVYFYNPKREFDIEAADRERRPTLHQSSYRFQWILGTGRALERKWLK